jgi:hypothetical protein
MTDDLDMIRVDAAKKYGVPVDLASRIRGNTPEEIAADARKLAEGMGVDTREPYGSADGGPRGTIPEPRLEMEDLLRAIANAPPRR